MERAFALLKRVEQGDLSHLGSAGHLAARVMGILIALTGTSVAVVAVVLLVQGPVVLALPLVLSGTCLVLAGVSMGLTARQSRVAGRLRLASILLFGIMVISLVIALLYATLDP